MKTTGCEVVARHLLAVGELVECDSAADFNAMSGGKSQGSLASKLDKQRRALRERILESQKQTCLVIPELEEELETSLMERSTEREIQEMR